MRVFAVTGLLAAGFMGSLTATAEVTYNNHVKPILSNNCFECHGPDEKARKAGLRLDTPEGAYAALKSGIHAIVPGQAADSELVARIHEENPNLVMPPVETGKTLSDAQKAILTEWIAAGAEYQEHWAFISPNRPAVPLTSHPDRVKNPVDAFVLNQLEQVGIGPSPAADRVTQLRRVHLDLTGLPPTIEQVEAFLADESPDAYEKRVDALLDSPHFGERWGRHWLDAARYADSNGYSIDGPRSIWPYRDWVIEAFNANMPFDRFVREQIAGDLLPDAGRSQRTATGFHRNTMINQEGGIDKEEFRLEAVFDRVNTTSTVFLGLTMACARCHTHKYDPIDHSEYFKMLAFFNSDNDTTLELPTPEQAEARKEVNRRVAEVSKKLEAYLDEAAAEKIPVWEASLTLGDVRKKNQKLQAALYALPESRTGEQRALIREEFKNADAEAQKFVREIEKIRAEAPNVPSTMVLTMRDEPRETHVFLGGDFTRKDEQVEAGIPAVLSSGEREMATRLDLADWLVDESNPLTARVTVNRFWQRLFGRGIVETENDFGTQGALPTHPDLLDWLAVEFMDTGWDVKGILKTICMSATYRQSSHARPELNDKDPRNDLLARQNRLRLEAEIIRDNALAVSGLIHHEIGGPSVFPPQPDGVMELGQVKRDWNVSDGQNRYRRGMYTYFWRATPHPGLMVFDAPDAQSACTRRVRSNTPLQSLTLLNGASFYECAQALGGMAAGKDLESDDSRIEWLMRACLGRKPSANERTILIGLLDRERARRAESGNDEAQGAWTTVARAVMNLDEFITRE